MAFDRPRTAIAVDFPGGVLFQLFYEGEVVYNSSGIGSPDDVNFFGVISDLPFDAAKIRNPAGGGMVIDNLFFGNAIPAPGAMALFAVAAITARRRRRE